MLATTMVYARVHNETVRRDYERAHARLSVADKSFNAPTQTAEPQPANAEAHCVYTTKTQRHKGILSRC